MFAPIHFKAWPQYTPVYYEPARMPLHNGDDMSGRTEDTTEERSRITYILQVNSIEGQGS